MQAQRPASHFGHRFQRWLSASPSGAAPLQAPSRASECRAERPGRWEASPPASPPLTVGADRVAGITLAGRSGRPVRPGLAVVHPAEPFQGIVAGPRLVLHRHHGEVRHGSGGTSEEQPPPPPLPPPAVPAWLSVRRARGLAGAASTRRAGDAALQPRPSQAGIPAALGHFLPGSAPRRRPPLPLRGTAEQPERSGGGKEGGKEGSARRWGRGSGWARRQRDPLGRRRATGAPFTFCPGTKSFPTLKVAAGEGGGP